MKITFFNSPVGYYSGDRYVFNPPLGLPILASIFNEAGHFANTVDLEAIGFSADQFVQQMKDRKNLDWVGFTALTFGARGMQECIQGLREAGYTGNIVCGGIHATMRPQEPLDWGADLVVTGECEGNVVELLESGAKGIHRGKSLPIEEIPIPDWDHFWPDIISYPGNHPRLVRPESIIQTSRGCPHRCTFCGNEIFRLQKKRWRPPEKAEAEFSYLHERGINALFDYSDEMLGTKHPEGWMKEYADRVEKFEIVWKCQGRCSQLRITEEVLKDAYRAGCRAVMWGVESFSPRVLKAMKKDITPDDIWHTLRLSKKVGLKNFLFTMVANAEETEDDLALTAEQLAKAYKERLVDWRQTTVCTALPGTEFYERQVREGWWHEAPKTGSQMHQIYQNTPWLTSDQIRFWLHKFSEVCPV